MTDITKFPRGAKPAHRYKLLSTVPHVAREVIPPQVAYVPLKLSYWLNNQYGDCVTAEEAFNKDVSGVFIDDNTVETWAGQGGFLNGAMLTDVMDAMAIKGFSQGGKIYGDGSYTAVDYSSEETIQSALSIAPVKIGIDANALPSTAGNGNGWHSFGGSPSEFRNMDHCVSLCGYGPAEWVFEQLATPVPPGIDETKTYYMLFTWSSIGVVDHAWIMSTVGEAWLRDPSTEVDGAPDPNPGPPPPPAPVPTPVPVPVPPVPKPPIAISTIELVGIGFGIALLVGGVTYLITKKN